MLKKDNEQSEICYLDEIIIEGITTEGKKFRPSDWVDRLCGMLAAVSQQKVFYSPYLRPLVYKDTNCVAIKKELETVNQKIYNFVMQFAKDNKLVVVDCAKFKNKIK